MQPPDSERHHWLNLHAAGVSPRQLDGLLAVAGTIAAVGELSVNQLQRHGGLSPHAAERIHKGAGADSWQDTLLWLAQPRHEILVWSDPRYPERLRAIPDPPILLFINGDTSLLSTPQLAVVGSRNPTPTGVETAGAFAAVLAQVGLTITSGLALGIDAAAHRGALSVSGRTVAVAGTGLDRVYPARHRALAHEIAASGVLVSEFPLGAPPKREHFPQRNRLISGLSLGVLVVEAAIQSGSLITARLAGEQGREVFAIPGSIHSPLARGCHALIRQGAKLVETAQDILEELGPQLGDIACMTHTTTATRDVDVDHSTHELLAAMAYDPVDIDTLAQRCGLTIGMISSMLLQMELRGLVAACPGGKYLRTCK